MQLVLPDQRALLALLAQQVRLVQLEPLGLQVHKGQQEPLVLTLRQTQLVTIPIGQPTMRKLRTSRI